MGVTHRVLYVGIGGTGVHIGKELEIALRRDLCGPDGKALINKGGAFGKLDSEWIIEVFWHLWRETAAVVATIESQQTSKP